MPIPTGRLALVAVAAAGLSLVSPVGLVATLAIVNGLVLTLLIVDAFAAPSPALVTVTRVLPSFMTVGQRSRVEWQVQNPTNRTLTIAVADQLAPSLGADDRRFRTILPAQGSARATTAIAPTRRGLFEVNDITVRVRGPLGLAARQRTRYVPSLLRVHPPFRSRDQAELRIRKARVLEVGVRSTRGRGGGTQFDQLRDYQSDDEFQRIDWAATARSQRPIVRTYRAERNQVVVQLLDNGRVMAGRVDGVPRVEHAMDAVMMLTAVAGHLGDKAGLIAFDRQVRAVVPPAAGKRQISPVTEAMFDLEPSLHESDYRSAFMYTLARFRRRSMLVLYTDLVEQAVGETLLPALPLIAGHHVLVVAAVQDPSVVRWAHGRPADSVEAYRQAAALATLADRGRATAALRGLGATVIDAPPGELASRLADVYLGIKATGRL
ncbi:MAG: DUF58 domain-containing protein [Acidimicrobiales bacterium]